MRIIRIICFLFILAAVPFTNNITASDIPGDIKDSASEIMNITLLPGDDIQKAIDSIADCGTLTLKAGSYDTLDSIVISGRSNLVLEGIGEVWINTKGIDHHVITLTECNNITLTNIKAQHEILEEGDNAPIADATDGAVVGILGGSNINIINCELVGCGIYGVYAKSATPVLLDGCYLHDNSECAILFVAGAKTMYAEIKDCMIMKNADSIEVRGDIELDMAGENNIEHNSPGDYSRRQPNN